MKKKETTDLGPNFQLQVHVERMAKMGAWEYHIHSDEFFWSEGVFFILEMSPKTNPLTLEKVMTVVHPDDRLSFAKFFEDVIKKKKEIQIKTKFITKSKTIKYIQSFGQVVFGAKNKPIKVIGIHQDITEQVETLKKYEDNQVRLNTIVNSEPECVKIVSASGKLLEMNPAGLQMIEADSLEKVFENSVYELIHPEDLKEFKRIHKCALAGQKEGGRFRIIGLKKTVRWMETTSVPLKDKTGKVNSVLSVTRDITAAVEAELNLQ
ncbi:PAS domain-containing protein, partial [Leptospira sp. 96542]|nr:PAS domain-containing protein [Leptospira sp. 96542]